MLIQLSSKKKKILIEIRHSYDVFAMFRLHSYVLSHVLSVLSFTAYIYSKPKKSKVILSCSVVQKDGMLSLNFDIILVNFLGTEYFDKLLSSLFLRNKPDLFLTLDSMIYTQLVT